MASLLNSEGADNHLVPLTRRRAIVIRSEIVWQVYCPFACRDGSRIASALRYPLAPGSLLGRSVSPVFCNSKRDLCQATSLRRVSRVPRGSRLLPIVGERPPSRPVSQRIPNSVVAHERSRCTLCCGSVRQCLSISRLLIVQTGAMLPCP